MTPGSDEKKGNGSRRDNHHYCGGSSSKQSACGRAWYLTLRGGENGETCVRYRLDEGDWFCVGFIHSVHKNPLIDCYQIQEHKIYVEQTYYYSFGAGVQSQLNEGSP